MVFVLRACRLYWIAGRYRSVTRSGKLPDSEDLIWTMSTLQVGVRISRRGTRRKRSKKEPADLPRGWLDSHRYLIVHQEVGGVTDGKFDVEIRTIIGTSLDLRSAPSVSGILGEAMDSMIPGRVTAAPKAGQANTCRGILKWNDRYKPVIASSVFVPGMGVKRKITEKEMASRTTFPEMSLDVRRSNCSTVLTSVLFAG